MMAVTARRGEWPLLRGPSELEIGIGVIVIGTKPRDDGPKPRWRLGTGTVDDTVHII